MGKAFTPEDLGLKDEELLGMIENIMEMAPVERILGVLSTAVAKKEQYCRTCWPDQPETFEYYERQGVMLTQLLAGTTALGKEIADRQAADRAERLETAKVERARQDKEWGEINAANREAAQQEALAQMAEMAKDYHFDVRIGGPNKDQLIAAFVHKVYWTSNGHLNDQEDEALSEILGIAGIVSLQESIYEIPVHLKDGETLDQTHVDKAVDFLQKAGFTQNSNFTIWLDQHPC